MKKFLENNPWSRTHPDEPGVISRPWADQSFRLELSRMSQKGLRSLDTCTLYPAFSAIYHHRRRSIECIFTPFRQGDEFGRTFDFIFENRTIKCEFAAPSELLLELALASEPVAARSPTNYRNLRDFRRYLAVSEQSKDDTEIQSRLKEIYQPVSFWIRNCPRDEEALKSIFEHLNFYMRYFDRETPFILIHQSAESVSEQEPEIRYLWDQFPEIIHGRVIDPYLLGQWVSARDAGDTYRQFLYYYQMLEYAAFYYLTDRSDRAIRTILKSPQTAAFPDQTWQRIQDALASEKIEDSAKLVAVVKQLVDPATLWREIESNRRCFEDPIEFDGGFVVPAIIAPSTDQAGFESSCIEKMVHTIRNIRNALVHAREKRMSNVIAPTAKNHHLVTPYLRPLSLMAMQVAVGVGNAETSNNAPQGTFDPSAALLLQSGGHRNRP